MDSHLDRRVLMAGMLVAQRHYHQPGLRGTASSPDEDLALDLRSTPERAAGEPVSKPDFFWCNLWYRKRQQACCALP